MTTLLFVLVFLLGNLNVVKQPKHNICTSKRGCDKLARYVDQ